MDNIKILENLKRKKISQMQLDPNGLCNVGCWFCPVAYKKNPEHAKNNMPKELLLKIIQNIMEERDRPDGIVSKTFGGFYTAHYNEILLYKHFDYLLEICRENKLCFMVLSNGTSLTKKKIDLISEYQDVVNGINLNIPIFSNAELWSKRVNAKPELHEKILDNIKYACEKLPRMIKNKTFSIGINGINNNSLKKYGGWIETGPNFPEDIDLDVKTGEYNKELETAKKLFPNVQVFGNPSLIDRAGHLSSVIDNKSSIKKNLMNNNLNKRVIGCGNGIEVGGRPFGWIHVNANGEAFLCCNDYDMDTIFGDFKTQTLREFWITEKHSEVIDQSFKTICRSCAAAIFENDV